MFSAFVFLLVTDNSGDFYTRCRMVAPGAGVCAGVSFFKTQEHLLVLEVGLYFTVSSLVYLK